MRITRQILLNIARDTVEQRKRSEWDLLSAYLIGSLLDDNPLLGGTTDIDLVFVHNNQADARREIISLSQDVHLDILHYSRTDLSEGRVLRAHPILGPEIYACQILYDPQHFMDFIQAGVRGHFARPDYILKRSRSLLDRSRRIWSRLSSNEEGGFGAQEVGAYLDAVECAANSFASLSGSPLPARRMMAELPARAEAAGKPGLFQGVLGLVGGNLPTLSDVHDWLAGWKKTFIAASAEDDCPVDLLPPRHAYYSKAIEVYLEEEELPGALWPLIQTWTQAAGMLSERSAHHRAWSDALAQLGLMGKSSHDRLLALDAFLDTLEENQEVWGTEHGA
jgi:hypothetical protein